MKSIRYFILFSFVLLGTAINAQYSLILSNLKLTDVNGVKLDANGLLEKQKVKLQITIINSNEKQVVEAGETKLIIELGDNLTLATEKDLSKLPYAEYFSWKLEKKENRYIISGMLKSVLPAKFAGLASFDLQCAKAGTSTATAQWAYDDSDKKSAPNSLQFTVLSKGSR